MAELSCGWVMVYRPCRAKKRKWTPSDLRRITCKLVEQGETEPEIRGAFEDGLRCGGLGEEVDPVECQTLRLQLGMARFYRAAWTEPDALGVADVQRVRVRIVRGAARSYAAVRDAWNRMVESAADAVRRFAPSAPAPSTPLLPETLPGLSVAQWVDDVLTGAEEKRILNRMATLGCRSTGGGF